MTEQETSKESLEYSKESEKFEFINDGILEQDELENLDPMLLCEVTYKIDEEVSDTDEEFPNYEDEVDLEDRLEGGLKANFKHMSPNRLDSFGLKDQVLGSFVFTNGCCVLSLSKVRFDHVD